MLFSAMEVNVEADIISCILLHCDISHKPVISNQVEEEASLREDFIFIKKLQRCIKEEGTLPLINCKDLKRQYEDPVKVSDSVPGRLH